MSSINKVLTQYLDGQVRSIGDGKWKLTQQNPLPGTMAKIQHVPNKETSWHEKPHILFVCGNNKWRGPTAERISISSGDVQWADSILVMENGYESWVLGSFQDLSLPEQKPALSAAGQQLDGADPASCGESSLRYYRRAGRAAHLEAVRRQAVAHRYLEVSISAHCQGFGALTLALTLQLPSIPSRGGLSC